MSGSCRIVTETEDGRTVLRLSGVFDRSSAVELRERLVSAKGAELVLDFSLVREFADLGVATLVNDLASAAGRLSLRGLRHHQLRMFRYFGLDVDSLHDRDDPRPVQ